MPRPPDPFVAGIQTARLNPRLEFAELSGHYLSQKRGPSINRTRAQTLFYETNPIREYGRTGLRSVRRPYHGEYLSALERLQGKKRLDHLPPKTSLIPAQPVDDFIVEVRQAQVAEGDFARGAHRGASAIFGAKYLLADFVIGLGKPAGSVLGSFERRGESRPGSAATQSRSRSLSLPLCHPKAEAAHLVIIDELNSGLFERCLDPDQCRNIAGNWPMAFFYALNRGRPDPGGLR